MSFKIPKSLKKEFKRGFEEYIKAMGRNVKLILKPHEVRCPNCFFDLAQKKSSNVYNTSFVRPVNIFPATTFKKIVYPAPFNVTTVSGIQYDPAIVNPKILQVSVCPVCLGEGVLIEKNEFCIKAVVDRGMNSYGGSKALDLSGGTDGTEVLCIKTYSDNYAICREAIAVIVDGIETAITIPPIIRGLGIDSLVEFYVTTIKEDMSSSIKYDKDSRLDINEKGETSDQAPVSTPTIPPNTVGEDDKSW
jgi:hypothetical protein